MGGYQNSYNYIASAFALDVPESQIKQFSIILSDSEFQEEESIPTLQSYLTFCKGGVGHTVFGLYVASEDYVEVYRTAQNFRGL